MTTPSTFTTHDRSATAEAYLDVACKEAVALFRDGCPGKAEFVLTAAALRAERILGNAA